MLRTTPGIKYQENTLSCDPTVTNTEGTKQCGSVGQRMEISCGQFFITTPGFHNGGMHSNWTVPKDLMFNNMSMVVSKMLLQLYICFIAI